MDADAQFAKQLGFDAKKGYEGGFWRKGGAIKNEQSLIEFLKDNGFLADIDTQSYEETSDLWNKVEDLIYNKDDAYNFNEAGKNARRENAVLARDMVEQLLRDVYDKDIDLLDQDLKAATKLLAEHGAVAVDKATLEYLNYSVKKLGKDYQKLLYQKKEERYAYQQKLTDFIKDLPNNFKDKAKFMDKIRMVKDERTFNKYLTEIKNRAEEYLKSEQKRLYADLIQKEVKSSRPRKLKMQKYDYENNTLFRDLREYNKLTADAAALKLATLPEDSLDEARALRLRRMFLQYKANGVKSSPELLQQLYEEIVVPNPNVRLVLCGHHHAAGKRVSELDDDGDGRTDRTVYQLLADYKDAPKGGGGFIRLLTFDPTAKKIRVHTYSPYLDQTSFYEDPETDTFEILL